MPDDLSAPAPHATTLSQTELGQRVAVVIDANSTVEPPSPADRAPGFVAELPEHGDDVALVFDGGGAATLAEVPDPGSTLHGARRKAAPALAGAGTYGAKAYGVHDALVAAGVPTLAEHLGHSSLRGLMAEGRRIVTF